MLCGRRRPNKQVGGGGRGSRICRQCRRMPKFEQQRLLRLSEIHGFLEQSNISTKNIKRLSILETDAFTEVAELASLVKRIALAKPGRRRRWKWLWRNNRELLQEAVKARLIDPLPPSPHEADDGFEWSPENDFFEDYFELENVDDIWIEPRSYEYEPSSAVIRRLFCSKQ
ncbi:hypothetical protein Poly59_31490 [Rubripirellula reticaptiva]|uniref:Uncharacterized protein n=1 Tax=Rubripirellula reticaptiva TaxID=2528013 RepID=A0A5C6EV95_9BACT|nr:hypothetical protein Poly59_31490 [Rubripirellula reticaptiva]